MSFKELFRKSAFVKNYQANIPVIARNSHRSPFNGSHFGLKRDLPVPVDGHRIIFCESLDESEVGFTRFTDITLEPGNLLILSLLREKLRAGGGENLAITGRFLGVYGKNNVVVGLAGIRAIVWNEDLVYKDWNEIEKKIASNTLETFYLQRVVGSSHGSSTFRKLPYSFFAQVSMKQTN